MDTEKFKVVVEVKKFIEFSDVILVNYPRSSRVLKDRIENYEVKEDVVYIDNHYHELMIKGLLIKALKRENQ